MGARPISGHPIRDLLVAQWPSLVFLPAVALVLITLVGVTRWYDRRDAALRAGSAVSRARGPIVVRPVWLRAGQRPWRRRTTCDCSWHTMTPSPLPHTAPVRVAAASARTGAVR